MDWSEACESVGYDMVNSKPPERIYTYFAYKEGKAIECSTSDEAKKISKNVEFVIANKEEIDDYRTRQSKLENKAYEVFHRSLRDEYSYLSDKIYNLCYSKAYEDGHSPGYDEVANYLYGYVDFAETIIAASKEN